MKRARDGSGACSSRATKKALALPRFQHVVCGWSGDARGKYYLLRYTDTLFGGEVRVGTVCYRVLSRDWGCVSDVLDEEHLLVQHFKRLLVLAQEHEEQDEDEEEEEDDDTRFWNITTQHVVPVMRANAYKILDPRLARALVRHYVCGKDSQISNILRWISIGFPAALVKELNYRPDRSSLIRLAKTDNRLRTERVVPDDVMYRAVMLCMRQPWFESVIKQHDWSIYNSPTRVTRLLAWKGVFTGMGRVEGDFMGVLIPEGGEPRALYAILAAWRRGPNHNVFGLLPLDVLRDHLFPWIKWSVPYPIPLLGPE